MLASSAADGAQLLDKLPYTEHATFDHYSRGSDALCLPNTRTQVLSDIMAWARGESQSASGGDNGPCIYWLDGMAGTGKSTIARTVARRFADEGRLGASFFFVRGGGELEPPRTLVTTIAVQLAQHLLALRPLLCDAVAEHPTIATKTLRDQWRTLVLRPLQELGGAADAQPPAAVEAVAVIVVDARDECSDEREIEIVLQLLSDTLGAADAPLKIFLTSGPEACIREAFDDVPSAQQQRLVLHHIEDSIVNRDIALFFEHSLGRVLRQRSLSNDQFEHGINILIEKAGGLFIWAATVCRFVHAGGPRAINRVDSVLAGCMSSASSSPERRLDEIFAGVLRAALRVDFTDEELKEVTSSLRIVLGSIAVLFTSLSAPSLELLLGIGKNEALNILCDLHSIIDVPNDHLQPIRTHHISVRDFLLDKRRCTDSHFQIDKQEAHAQLARYCLRVLNKILHKDLCDLRLPDARTPDLDVDLKARYLPPHLR